MTRCLVCVAAVAIATNAAAQSPWQPTSMPGIGWRDVALCKATIVEGEQFVAFLLPTWIPKMETRTVVKTVYQTEERTKVEVVGGEEVTKTYVVKVPVQVREEQVYQVFRPGRRGECE